VAPVVFNRTERGELIAEKGYDTDAFRSHLKKQRIKPAIPGKSNRKKANRSDEMVYNGRNVALLLSPQRLPPHRHALRRARQKLLLDTLPRRCGL